MPHCRSFKIRCYITVSDRLKVLPCFAFDNTFDNFSLRKKFCSWEAMLSSSYWATHPNEIAEQDRNQSVESFLVIDKPWTTVSIEIGSTSALTLRGTLSTCQSCGCF